MNTRKSYSSTVGLDLHVTALILTLNEELHIARCLKSLASAVDRMVVVDCFSTDNTAALAIEMGAEVLQHEWDGYANQINWALEQCAKDTDWIFRVDADESLTPESQTKLRKILQNQSFEVAGLTVSRKICFLGKELKHGGITGGQVLRIFRAGSGHCEERLVDEHIVVDGVVARSGLSIVDDNLNSISWMVEKHNRYASLEAIETLNYRYQFLPADQLRPEKTSGSTKLKRRVKEKLYWRLPMGFRAGLYFIYRYFFMLGFLDGRPGFFFAVFQGLLYRLVVDMKINQVERCIEVHRDPVEDCVSRLLKFEVRKSDSK